MSLYLSHFSFLSRREIILKMSTLKDWLNQPSNILQTTPRNVIINGEQVTNTSLEEVTKLSKKFPVKFPIDTAKCKILKETVSVESLERNINSAYPIIHEKTLQLFCDFLLHKRKFGSEIEQKLYEKMAVVDLVDRLLMKRAICFVGPGDLWKLRDGTEGSGSWKKIGTPEESGQRTLKNYLSYDEIKLSALLSVSSYTHFLNDGSRGNRGIPASDRTKIEHDGIIIGLIGTRFEKPNVMDYQEIIIEHNQNHGGNGYGPTFAPTMMSMSLGFYNTPNLTYDEFINSSYSKSNYKNLGNGRFFDNKTYKKRLALSIGLFLLEANHRARKQNKFAFAHVVGIGLGVWRCSSHQEEVFMETMSELLQFHGQDLHSLSDVQLAYIDSTTCGKYKDGEIMPIAGHPKGGIQIHINRKEPHLKLTGEHEGKLLVVSYAWDGNAMPGNEYWLGSLEASGDPAAACATQITELHNAYINKMVCGNNLHIATSAGVKCVDRYLEDISK